MNNQIKRKLSQHDRTTLMMDTGLKPKSKDSPYPREDGEIYSFKITVAGKVFCSSSFFGTKEAQRKAMQEIIEAWPEKIELEVLK